ncbi:MAG: sulfate adenylyltransferase subunit 1 [Burkholderiales bacterium]|jgi:sulfate adenylyltransferase subunit 1
MKRDDMNHLQQEDLGVLRFLTCGSVDDGKSTLIGRLLYDTKTLLTDTIATLEKNAHKRGLSALDLSLLTDGLMAEREQGITIDVAYRYFATARRKFIIADAPGHEQYTRNMVTAASTADVAILLVDARKGLLPQTKRHATLAGLLGIQHWVLAINKMDLVDYQQTTFDTIVHDFEQWLGQHPEMKVQVQCIPMSALEGEMVVSRGNHLAWYAGPTLLEVLEAAPSSQLNADAALRFPVQWVCRPAQSEVHHDFRAYAGRIESGSVSVGDELLVLPAGKTSRVSRIGLGETELASAFAGQSVMISLADDIDISRGDMLVKVGASTPTESKEQTATVCWLSSETLSPARSYLVKHTTREVKARISSVEARLDIHTLSYTTENNAAPVQLNDIVRLKFKTQQALFADAYAQSRATGSFILIDEASHNTVAAGLLD